MKKKVAKTSEIKVTVHLDENALPEEMTWEASDAGSEGPQPCKTVIMSLWDPSDRSTLRIDLWTKDMPVDEMKQFFYETFVTMADTYERACDDASSAKEIRTFAKKFGEMTEVLKKRK